MIVRRRWLVDAEDACARRFSVCKVVIYEQRGSRLGQGGRDFSYVESACGDGCLVHIRCVGQGSLAFNSFCIVKRAFVLYPRRDDVDLSLSSDFIRYGEQPFFP